MYLGFVDVESAGTKPELSLVVKFWPHHQSFPSRQEIMFLIGNSKILLGVTLQKTSLSCGVEWLYC